MGKVTWEQMIANGRKRSVNQVLNEEYEEFFGRPKRVGMPLCPKCDIQMEIGLAVQEKNESCKRDLNAKVEYKFHSNTDMEFTRCKKCPKCGHSETL